MPSRRVDYIKCVRNIAVYFAGTQIRRTPVEAHFLYLITGISDKRNIRQRKIKHPIHFNFKMSMKQLRF